MKEVKEFYEDLYKKRQTNPELELRNTEAKITMEELSACLAKTRNNVAPGSSGFMGAFYKVFWVDLKSLVLKTIHDIFDDNTLPVSQRYGIVSIIPKAGKDNTLIQNWCPLTLLNTLYKLISSILSVRLKHVLSRILGLHQRAYIPGRYIGEVTRNVYDAFLLAKQQNNPVSFDFINVTLDAFGFGQVFKN